jgi:hypothetical protein
MTTEYDEKGKFYTNVVSKVAVPSIIQTTTHLIRGFVHVRQGDRYKDAAYYICSTKYRAYF